MKSIYLWMGMFAMATGHEHPGRSAAGVACGAGGDGISTALLPRPLVYENPSQPNLNQP